MAAASVFDLLDAVHVRTNEGKEVNRAWLLVECRFARCDSAYSLLRQCAEGGAGDDDAGPATPKQLLRLLMDWRYEEAKVTLSNVALHNLVRAWIDRAQAALTAAYPRLAKVRLVNDVVARAVADYDAAHARLAKCRDDFKRTVAQAGLQDGLDGWLQKLELAAAGGDNTPSSSSRSALLNEMVDAL